MNAPKVGVEKDFWKSEEKNIQFYISCLYSYFQCNVRIKKLLNNKENKLLNNKVKKENI